MRILINMPSQFAAKHSGVSRMAFCLLEHLLDQTDHDFVLRSPWSYAQLPTELQHKRLSVIQVSRPKIMVLNVLMQIFSVKFLCRREKIDLIINIDPFGAYIPGFKTITIVHDLYFKIMNVDIGRLPRFTNDLIFKLMAAHGHNIVCVSESTRQDLIRFYPKLAKVSCIIHSDSTLFVNRDHIFPKSPISGRYILVVGNATPNKNFAVVARAFSKLSRLYSDIKLVHVGDDMQEVILSNIEDLAIRKNVYRKQGINDLELASLYKHALCLCVPSIYEGFCLPVLEAQDFSCPVVCSNCSATPEIAGKGAMTFEPQNVDMLVKSICLLMDNDDLAKKLRQDGHENKSLFSWKIAAESYAHVIKTAL